jgi:hypothetical protein
MDAFLYELLNAYSKSINSFRLGFSEQYVVVSSEYLVLEIKYFKLI